MNITILCQCGNELTGEWQGNNRYRDPVYEVPACEKCIEKQREEAEQEGYDKGVADTKEA